MPKKKLSKTKTAKPGKTSKVSQTASTRQAHNKAVTDLVNALKKSGVPIV